MISRFDQLVRTIANVLKTGDLITVLTGAGVSAESGIPTFRGPEGYWTVGSRNYQPSEIATQAMFQRNPKEIWKWFLYRRGICEDALPNPGHLAIVKMEKLLGSRFRLVTQNVDGLHLRAGSNIDRTYQVHGNLNYMRCARECSVPARYILFRVACPERREATIFQKMSGTCSFARNAGL
ncbi:MAG: Sir2 family NAD-dependent protein deacetylase [Methyloglobulus sp.]